MFSSMKKWITRIFAGLIILMLISAVSAGHLTHDVITDVSTWWHTSGLHGPKVTPPKVKG
jgi:hypothetical protein